MSKMPPKSMMSLGHANGKLREIEMNCSVVKKDLSALIMIGSSKSEKEKRSMPNVAAVFSGCVSNEVLIARFALLAKFVPIIHTVGAQVVR